MDDSTLTAFRKAEKHFKSRHAHALQAVKVKKRQNKLLASLGFGGSGPSTRTARPSDYPVLKGHGVLNLSGTPEELGEDEVVLAGWDIDRADVSGGREFEEITVEKLDDYDGEGFVPRTVKAYIIGDGLIYIPKYLSPEAQLRLMRSSLEEYTLPPNPLNLSTHYVLPPDFSLFGQYVKDPDHLVDSKAASASRGVSKPITGILSPEPLVGHKSNDQNDTCASSVAIVNTPKEGRSESPVGSETASMRTTSTRSSQRELISNQPAHQEGYEALKQKVALGTGDLPSHKLKSKTVGKLMENELRWANLGWVYNVSSSECDIMPAPLSCSCWSIGVALSCQWPNKAYDFTSANPIPFPSPLARTCQQIVRGIPWPIVFGSPSSTTGTDTCSKLTSIKPDHWQDWIEDYKPDTGIVNFYHLKDTLMGHVDRSDGDVIVMSGQSRNFYHGVPRVMEGTLPSHFQPKGGDDVLTQACKRFMGSARININARQVFPVNFVHP
ncbi:hypothetical protein QFC22_005110 [Naganishia vaughanmartiniae]|uniref:Uncharacterized protein n=1 Tax=Naganishia vaughanmartiniae TaxID=1424756 RepID=A0ACC2WZM4_9TREE|nr:hypothetical protein QFC22_005110 [Naganishia vaughanmartiniae]